MTTVHATFEGVDFSIVLPEDAIEAITQKERWRGRVNVTPKVANGKGRINAIEAHITNTKKYRNVCRATVNQRNVIKAWNNNEYILALESVADREVRNFPLPFNKIRENLPLVSRAIREVEVANILKYMKSYFAFCATGGHIWDGRNHGFKTLTGFLEKLIRLKKEKTEPWWTQMEAPATQVHDLNTKLTNRVANSFAQTFMEEKKFPLEVGSKEHGHFIKTAAQIVSYINRKKRQGVELTETQMITYLLEFVMDLFNEQGDVVYPAHLSSSAVWASFPQYLSEKGLL